jgi:hypothetical protein
MGLSTNLTDFLDGFDHEIGNYDIDRYITHKIITYNNGEHLPAVLFAKGFKATFFISLFNILKHRHVKMIYHRRSLPQSIMTFYIGHFRIKPDPIFIELLIGKQPCFPGCEGINGSQILGVHMKALVLAVLLQVPFFAMASFTQLTCSTITQDATVRVLVTRAVDPQNPWVGFNTISANLEVQIKRAYSKYATAITLSPISGSGDLNMRGDAAQGGVYLQLYPQIVNGQATGKYTGQLFVNDLDKREYFDFRSEGGEPGLVCK